MCPRRLSILRHLLSAETTNKFTQIARFLGVYSIFDFLYDDILAYEKSPHISLVFSLCKYAEWKVENLADGSALSS